MWCVRCENRKKVLHGKNKLINWSYVFSLHVSRDFEIIGYVQFHVMYEFGCKF